MSTVKNKRFVLGILFLMSLTTLFSSVSSAQEKDEKQGDPKEVKLWGTLTSDHFNIHFPKELVNYAVEFRGVAESALADVTTRLDWKPKGKINLIITNESDQSNGFATVAPYNYIKLYVAPPQANTSLDQYKDYWRLLLQHELTHIVHIDQHHGLVTPFRLLFGKLLNPNAGTPTWMREGMAVYEESQLDEHYGRNNGDYSKMVLRSSVYDDAFPRIDQIGGLTPHFPGGSGPYLFGGEFFDWLGKTYGEDRMYKYQQEYASSFWLYSLNNKARRVYGKKFPELWNEFTENQKREALDLKEKLTESGLTSFEPLIENKKDKTTLGLYAPRPHSTGYAYFERGFDEGSRLFIYPSAQDKPIILKKVAIGQMNFSKDGRYLAFSTLTSIQKDSLHYEVYLYDLEKKKLGRMFDKEHQTLSMHATDPDWSPQDEGKRWLVMVRQFIDTDQLTIFDAVEKKNYIITNAETKTQFSNPRFSPDGEFIVVSRKEANGQRDIVLYSKLGVEISKITNDVADDNFPIFSGDGREIYFSSFMTGVSNIFSYNLETQTRTQLTNVLTGVFQPILLPDQASLAVEVYGSFGNALHKMNLEGKVPLILTAPETTTEALVQPAEPLPVETLTSKDEAVIEAPADNPTEAEAITAPVAESTPPTTEPTQTVPTEEPVSTPLPEAPQATTPEVAPETTAPETVTPDSQKETYKKNRRGNRDLDLGTSPPTQTSPFDLSSQDIPPTDDTNVSPEEDSAPKEKLENNKEEPSLYKDALQNKLSTIPSFEAPNSVRFPYGAKGYNALKYAFLPRYVQPSIVSSESSTLFSVSTGNFDPLSWHVWNASANYRTDANYLGASGMYIYSRWKPTFFMGALRYAVDWGDLDGQQFFEDRWQIYGGGAYKLKSHLFALSYFYEDRSALTDGVDSALLLNMKPYSGLRFRYKYGKWDRYADSVSQEDGFLFKLGADVVDEILGSHDINEEVVATVDARYYLEMPWSNHHVLAMRSTLGWKFGDPQINGVFRLGGPFGEGIGTTPLSNRVFPMRGLPGISLAGDRAFLASLEYRLPLVNNINRGISTWPIFLDKLHLAFFADAGDITYDEYDLFTRVSGATDGLFTRLMVSPGVELRADFVLGYEIPITMRLGYAIIVTNQDRVDVLTDPITGESIRYGTVYTQVGTSF